MNLVENKTLGFQRRYLLLLLPSSSIGKLGVINTQTGGGLITFMSSISFHRVSAILSAYQIMKYMYMYIVKIDAAIQQSTLWELPCVPFVTSPSPCIAPKEPF